MCQEEDKPIPFRRLLDARIASSWAVGQREFVYLCELRAISGAVAGSSCAIADSHAIDADPTDAIDLTDKELAQARLRLIDWELCRSALQHEEN